MGQGSSTPTHLAPPCKSFTKARRSDKFGATKVVRSQAQPEGWGDPLTVEGNKIVVTISDICGEMNPLVWKFDTLWEHPLVKGEATCHSSFLYSLCTEDTWKATARVHRVMEDW